MNLEVLWAGTFVPAFERNKRLSEYLTASNIGLRKVRVDLWPEDRVAAFTDSRWSLLFKMAWVYPLLFGRLLFHRRPDVYLVSYPGWFDVPVVKAVAWLKRRPLVFDIFISLHDTAISDRALASPLGLVGRLTKTIDRAAIRCADRVVTDTRTHAVFLSNLAGVSRDRFGVVYLGADESIFSPVAEADVDHTKVVFYGTFVPLQGVDVIVRAAALLGDMDVHFKLIGGGQTHAATVRLAQELEIARVDFPGPMSQEALRLEMASAGVCLGVFGRSEKADRVVPHKVYEALAVGRPVVTGNTTAIREVFTDEVLTVTPHDPQGLADVLRKALADPAALADVGRAGHDRFLRDFSRQPQGDRLLGELAAVL